MSGYPLIRIALLLSCPAILACGGEDARTSAVVRDSAGISIAENAAPDSARVTWWHLDPEARFDVGKIEGTESETLYQVNGAVQLSDGRVAIANAGTSEVRYYAPDGQHIVSAGRSGGGPGEFQRITKLILLPGDSVAVVDPAARRLSVLGPTGAFAREVVATADVGLNVVGRKQDGAWIASTAPRMVGDQIQSGLVRPDLVYVSVPPAGGVVLDTLGRFPGSERYIQIHGSAGTIEAVNIGIPPFARATTVIAEQDQLYVAAQDAAEIRVHGTDGALMRIVRTGVPLRPVTPELIAELVDRQLAGLDAERRAAAHATQPAIAGEYVPPYGTIAVDRSGNLWVQDFPGLEDAQRWTVYDRAGSLRARIALPTRFTPYDIGDDWILGRELDELDVEHMRLYGIQRSLNAR
jgi:hypothetical protein